MNVEHRNKGLGKLLSLFPGATLFTNSIGGEGRKKVTLGVGDAKVHIASCHRTFVMNFRDLKRISVV